MKGRYIKKGVALGMLLAVASISMTMAMEARIRSVNQDTHQVVDIIEGAPPVTIWEGLTTEGRNGRIQVELQRDGDGYKLIYSGEVEGRSHITSASFFLSREELIESVWSGAKITAEGTGKLLVREPTLKLSYNNKYWIQPTWYDDSSDFAKASRYRLDQRPSYRVPVTDTHFVWVTYHENQLDTLYNRSNKKIKRRHSDYRKSEDMKILQVGLDRIQSDTMTQGIYFLYGSDRTKYYKKIIPDDQIRYLINRGAYTWRIVAPRCMDLVYIKRSGGNRERIMMRIYKVP